MITIRNALKSEFDKVRSFYHSMIDAMENAQYTPGWKKDIYPSDEDLKNAIQNQELFIGILNNRIVASMVVNHECNESYNKINWSDILSPEEVTLIHMLGVHPDFSGKGFAKKMVAHAIMLAEKTGQKAIRLDVLEGNLPAERLYSGLGFQYVDMIPMYYEDTGWVNFKLYELSLVK